MKQLSGLDAAFLYMETPNAPQHVAGLTIYDQSTAPEGKVRFKDIIENYYNRICSLPSMTSKLVNVPLNLDHPYWVSDGHFDPEFHIRHLALPKPGDWRQLDRDHPLWEAYIIEGLDDVEGMPKGSFAVFSKVHHAAIDGATGTEMTAAVHDLTPNYKFTGDSVAIPAEQEPGTWDLLVRAQINTLKWPFNFISVARNTVPGMAKVLAMWMRGKLEDVYKVPRTRFNSTISPYRVFDAVTFSLQEIKDIKNTQPGVTVNDVAISLCGGALRKYLEAHEELPEESLVAMVPVNVRTAVEKDSGGNVVSFMRMQVRSDIEDPLTRLQAVHESSREAKILANAVDARAMTDYNQFIPSTLTAQAARLASSWGLANRIKPVFNCVITNVPGPQVPLYSTGAKMVASFGAGPLTDGLALMHVIGSYCGQLTISVTSCRKIMPDPDFYSQCLQDSFDELQAATKEVA